MKYLIVNDIPTPWREPVFERVYQRLDGLLDVVYFKGNEKRRLWNFHMGSYPKTVLPALTVTTRGTERFFNPGMAPYILRRHPRIALVATCIKDPSGWLALIICKLLGTKIALLEDTWLGRDYGINGLQRLARRVVFNWFADAFVGSSIQSLNLCRHYNPRILPEQMFLSHLVADNEYFRARLNGSKGCRPFDILFSGRIVDVKNPLFFANVCAEVKEKRGVCKVLIIGDGDEHYKARMRQIFAQHGVEYTFAGFIDHARLPDFYAQAKLLLLPTSGDCWGVVINEAMIAGTPVITTDKTPAAGELVIHEHNGYVLPLDISLWSSTISGLLSDPDKWESFSRNGLNKVKEFNFDRAAEGILAAFSYLEARKSRTS